ncbi:hypothetical protein JCM3770_004950 [Rhodotorula araucariae]
MPSCLWEQVGMDFVIVHHQLLHGGIVIDSILTVTDYLSKFVILIPLFSTATTLQVAELFFLQVVHCFGLPANIMSDWDPKFHSAFWHAYTSAPILHILWEDLPDDWLPQFVACELALNASISALTSLAPFEVIHGFIPPLSLSFWGAASNDENCYRRDDADLFAVGNKVYVSLSLVKFPPAMVFKFLPKYISP